MNECGPTDSGGLYVLPAPVRAQPPQGHDVARDDQQGPEREARKEEHLGDGVYADHGDPEPAGYLVADDDPERGEQLQDAENEDDPSPGTQVTDDVARAGDVHASFHDRGDTVDQVEETEHREQRRCEDDHPVASTIAPSRGAGTSGCHRRHWDLPVQERRNTNLQDCQADPGGRHPSTGDSAGGGGTVTAHSAPVSARNAATADSMVGKKWRGLIVRVSP